MGEQYAPWNEMAKNIAYGAWAIAVLIGMLKAVAGFDLPILLAVTMLSFLLFRGSPESRDGQDEMMQSLERIEGRLGALEVAGEEVADHVETPALLPAEEDQAGLQQV